MIPRNFLLAATVAGMIGWAAVFAIYGWWNQARAGEDWMVVSIASHHFERNGQNERNLGLGYERRLSERWSFTAGGYNNSSSDLSLYAAGAYTPWKFGNVRWGMLGGAVTGYEKAHRGGLGPCLLGGFTGTVEWERFGFNGVWIPAAGGVLFLQAKWRF